MQVSYQVRPSLGPRVMRVVGQLASRSIHRGTTGLCIELRNHHFVVPDLILTGVVMRRQRGANQ